MEELPGKPGLLSRERVAQGAALGGSVWLEDHLSLSLLETCDT